jgi:hypothetical protein
MKLAEAIAAIGSDADLLTSDGWLVRVRIQNARRAYGNVRFEVVGRGKTAIVDQARLVTIYEHDQESYEQEQQDTASYAHVEALTSGFPAADGGGRQH